MNVTNSRSDDGWIRVFEVKEPQKHRKGYTVYKVISRVFHKNSIEGITEIVTYKRYSEFKKLHKCLANLHFSLHLKGIVPPFPESKLFGRFDEEVVETRRQSALDLLEFAAKHPPLFTSNVFVKFFENSTTNFKTVSPQQVIDSTADECINHLPQPLEPNVSLSPTDNWSARSDLSDGSSYYSTPIHSFENSVNEQKLTNSKTELTEFDPLVNRENSLDSSQSRREIKQNNNWFIYAIQSCDNDNHESSQLKIATIDNEDNVSLPKPFSENESNDKISIKDINVTLNQNESIRETENVNINSLTHELETNDNQNQNDNSVQISENNCAINLLEDETNKESVSTLNQTNESNETYLLDAATLIGQAQQHEQSREYEAAFESYKCAVGILLQGVSNETDSEKMASIRRKTFQYLTRAEQIYDTYLNESQSFQPNRRWAPDSPFKSFKSSFISSWFGSCHELTKFKVIGIISKVQIVVDMTTNNIFVIKVIYKSNIENSTNISSNTSSLPQSIFPHDIPFMVQIYRIFKTEYALFLLLEFAKGGKLWDHISSNSQGSPLSPCPDCTFAFDDKEDYLIANNTYSGRRFSRTKSESYGNVFLEENDINEEQTFAKSEAPKLCSPSGSLASIESIDYDIPSKSYLSLCNNYAFSQQKSDQSSLANCKLGYISDSIDSIDSITECDSKAAVTSEQSSIRFTTLSQSKRQLSTESLGISGLLAKARGILRNVDQTLRATKNFVKNETKITDRINLRESKSEMSLFQTKSRRISEVFHQMDANSNSLRNTPQVTEAKAKVWLSQIVKCLQHLHKLGIIYCDLKPENILLSENENIMIAYKCFWNELPHNVIDENARERLFVAPELNKSDKISPLCDYWTLGVIAYELLTSRPLVSYHPNGITSHTLLYFPEFVSLEAKDLLNNLLEPNPSERLGRHGPEEIITHPFFEGINWTHL